MQIKILDSWLKEHLKTNATPQKIGECLSLCGPSVERVARHESGWIYNIEVTTNRPDLVSVYGVAREASAILPRFGYKAKLLPLQSNEMRPLKNDQYSLVIKTDPRLTKRVMAVVLDNVKNQKSPDWIRNRLESAGIRSLGTLIDITNYVMLEVGHPTHVFDYNLIKTQSLVFRESNPGEKIVTLDGKEYSLPGKDIVIDDGNGEIVDLPGIMGTKNSVVDPNTKRIIFFIDNNDPGRMRSTSMALGIRTQAATLNEKGVDPELAKVALLRGTELYQRICGAKIASKVHDIYTKPYKTKTLTTTIQFIEERLGVNVGQKEVVDILESLGLKTTQQSNNIIIAIPSWRADDVNIPEDIVEEVARIYGYHNLPSVLMTGSLPEKLQDSTFNFERRLKNLICALGGVEVYTSSLVSKDMVGLQGYSSRVLKLKNPLGQDTEYLRTSLAPPLAQVASQNKTKEPIHLFEVANVYLARKGNLPEEKMTLAGVLVNYNFREARGTVEELLTTLGIEAVFEPEDSVGFLPNQRLSINIGKKNIGEFGVLDSGPIYYEFEVETLATLTKQKSYQPPAKYPAQVEDITLVVPPKTYLGELIETMKKSDKNITSVELEDSYKDTQTLRVCYQNPAKTLTDKEVDKIRKKMISQIKKKFGVRAKA